MDIKRVVMEIEDGTIDSVGGIKFNYTDAEIDDSEVLNIKAQNAFGNYEIRLTGAELKRLKELLRG